MNIKIAGALAALAALPACSNNEAANTAGAAIAVGDGPSAIAITPDGKTAFVANTTADTVTPVDLATNTPAAARRSHCSPAS